MNLRYALVVLLTTGCTQDFGAFRGSGGGGQGGQGTGGSGGSPPVCENDCNDSNPCTQDICDPDGECLHPAAEDPPLTQVVGDCKNISCDGTMMLTEADATDLPPDDGNDCTTDECDGDMIVHPFAPEGTACNDKGVCNATGECSDCDDAADCGTDTQCATYACNNNACETTFLAPLVISGDEDGDCMALQCADNEPDPQDLPLVTDIEDDSNTCTTDTCSAAGDPEHTPTPGASCSDGLFCTMTDTCNAAGTCVGTGDPCAGGAECQDTCNETNNDCDNPVGDPCGTTTNNECTDPDTCNGMGACVLNNEPNGTACGSATNADCNNPDTCMNGACQANLDPAGTACGNALDDACTNPDTCDAAGNCLPNHAPAGTACGSATVNTCTAADTCNATGTCLANNAPNGTTCNDSLPCTMTDTCQGGTCTGTGNPCAGHNTGTSCDDSCNPATGACTAADAATNNMCNEIPGGMTGTCSGNLTEPNCVGDT